MPMIEVVGDKIVAPLWDAQKWEVSLFFLFFSGKSCAPGSASPVPLPWQAKGEILIGQ